jgi:hypothetical protein
VVEELARRLYKYDDDNNQPFLGAIGGGAVVLLGWDTTTTSTADVYKCISPRKPSTFLPTRSRSKRLTLEVRRSFQSRKNFNIVNENLPIAGLKLSVVPTSWWFKYLLLPEASHQKTMRRFGVICLHQPTEAYRAPRASTRSFRGHSSASSALYPINAYTLTHLIAAVPPWVSTPALWSLCPSSPLRALARPADDSAADISVEPSAPFAPLF